MLSIEPNKPVETDHCQIRQDFERDKTGHGQTRRDFERDETTVSFRSVHAYSLHNAPLRLSSQFIGTRTGAFQARLRVPPRRRDPAVLVLLHGQADALRHHVRLLLHGVPGTDSIKLFLLL